jgi:hypothetical protein
MANEAEDIDATTSAAAPLKLPVFWTTDPELWFVQIEAQFTARNITSDLAKYSHLVSALSAEIAFNVRDVLMDPPPTNKYQLLKTTIITQTADEVQIRELITTEQMEDKKPAQFLKRLKQLRGKNKTAVPDELLRHIFLQRLPHTAQVALTIAEKTDLDQMAIVADKVMAISPTTLAAAEAASSESNIRQELEELKRRVAREVEGRRTSQRQKKAKDTEKEVCSYHQRFGASATKCREPCSYQGNAQGSH